MATITASAVKPVDVWGSQAFRLITLQPAASDYTTGGYPLTPGTNINLNSILFAFPVSNTGGFVLQWDEPTSSMIVYEQSGATGALVQPGAGTDLSAFTFLIAVLGY